MPVNELNFYASQRITTGTPLPAGWDECVSRWGLNSCTQYCYAVKTLDSAGHWSAISNSVSGQTLCSGTLNVMCE